MKVKSNSNNVTIVERYVSIKVASKYTSLAESTLYEWAGTGRIPSIKIGRRVLFDLHDIDRIMNSLKRSNGQEERTVNKIIADFSDGDI